jgi:hypothetical protein
MKVKTKFTRREVLQIAALTPIAVSGCATTKNTDLPVVRAEDPVARAVLYYPNSKDVPADHPLAKTHKPEQKCADCVHIRGKDGDDPRPCPLFPGRLINADGWCSLWTQG